MSGIPHWKTFEILIGVIPLVVFGRLEVVQMLEITSIKGNDSLSKYSLMHLGIDVGLYASFAMIGFYLGWQVLIAMTLNYNIATWVGDYYKSFLQDWTAIEQPESVQRKEIFWSIVSCLFCLLGILAYWRAWTLVMMALIHLPAIVTVMKRSINTQRWKDRTFIVILWAFVTDVEVFFGCLHGGILSFLLVAIILASRWKR